MSIIIAGLFPGDRVGTLAAFILWLCVFVADPQKAATLLAQITGLRDEVDIVAHDMADGPIGLPERASPIRGPLPSAAPGKCLPGPDRS
jgi:hypothetical protein